MPRDVGYWIVGYTNPKPDRYQAGLKAGQMSQTGFILKRMMRFLIESNGSEETDAIGAKR